MRGIQAQAREANACQEDDAAFRTPRFASNLTREERRCASKGCSPFTGQAILLQKVHFSTSLAIFEATLGTPLPSLMSH